MRSPPDPRRLPLEVVCVGTGRDGTKSLEGMIRQMLEAEGQARTSAHEYGARDFYNAFCGYQETGDRQFIVEIATLIGRCPHECIVGNGYAPVLDIFSQVTGRPVRLVHVQRRDRDKCVRSLIRDAEDMPEAYGYYTSLDPNHMKRIAAFHFGEMSFDEWRGLTLFEKFAWYYDKTHSLIERSRGGFADYLHVHTEDLSELSTRRALAQFLQVPDTIVPAPVHVNTNVESVASLAPDRRFKAHWLLRPIDLQRIVDDDVALVDHAFERLATWLGYKLDGSIRTICPSEAASPQDIRATLRRARQCAEQYVAILDELESRLDQRSQPAARPGTADPMSHPVGG